MIISPRLRGGGSGGSVRSSLGLRGLSLRRLGLRSLGRLLNLNPLLRSSQVIALVHRVPLLLSCRVGSAISNVCVRDRSLAFASLSRGLINASVGQGYISARIDLRQAGVGDGGIGLHRMGLSGNLLILCGFLGSLLSREQGSGVGGSPLLHRCDCNKLDGGLGPFVEGT